MTVYLVRHAHAGNRDRWDGDDRDRPLSERGWAQAHAIAERLASTAPASLWSSPYVRCLQTLEPLAETTSLPVSDSLTLAEGAGVEEVLELLDGLDMPAVCCSHGDVIPATIEELYRRGVEVTTAADWRKATVWVLSRDGSGYTKAAVWPPPPR